MFKADILFFFDQGDGDSCYERTEMTPIFHDQSELIEYLNDRFELELDTMIENRSGEYIVDDQTTLRICFHEYEDPDFEYSIL